MSIKFPCPEGHNSIRECIEGQAKADPAVLVASTVEVLHTIALSLRRNLNQANRAVLIEVAADASDRLAATLRGDYERAAAIHEATSRKLDGVIADA